jgi:hypothetical protein
LIFTILFFLANLAILEDLFSLDKQEERDFWVLTDPVVKDHDMKTVAIKHIKKKNRIERAEALGQTYIDDVDEEDEKDEDYLAPIRAE